ncbi:MAG: PPOX class F420-dependent oxidoreductase [Chloroflexota bacterium]
MRLPDPARALIESGAHAHLVTINPDGSPQVTIIWMGLDGDDLIAAHLRESQKVKNIRRDGRVAITFEGQGKNPMGLMEYLIVYGQATITEGGAPELLQKLAYTYIGPGVKFPTMDDPPPGYITHVKVERIGGVGPWAG